MIILFGNNLLIAIQIFKFFHYYKYYYVKI